MAMILKTYPLAIVSSNPYSLLFSALRASLKASVDPEKHYVKGDRAQYQTQNHYPQRHLLAKIP
jgi:hypothetical protein